MTDQRESDLLDGRAIRDVGSLLARHLRADVERRRENRRQGDVERCAEEAEDEREQPDVQKSQPSPRSSEHQVSAEPDLSRYPAPRTVSIMPSRRPPSILRRRLRM